MSTRVPDKMAQSEVLQKILSTSAAKNIKLAAARGAFPLVSNELLFLLVHLAEDQDPEVSEQAARTIREMPDSEILGALRSDVCDPEVLAFLASNSSSSAVREAVILNPLTPGPAIARLAVTVGASLLELILENRVRLLESPEILSSIKINMQSTPAILRLLREIEAEFFGTKKSSYSLDGQAQEEVVQESEGETVDEGEDLSLEGLPLDHDEREQALFVRLSKMNVRDKIKRAMLGSREERVILIRDTNKQISKAVLQSPKLSESEVETFAAMRNVSDEILREIGNSREWTKRYNVAQNLVKNPKTPAFISQKLLIRLHSKDLALLSRDRGVPEPVRKGAHRTLARRSQKT